MPFRHISFTNMGASHSNKRPNPKISKRSSVTLSEQSPSAVGKPIETPRKIRFRMQQQLKRGSLRSSRKYYQNAMVRKSRELSRHHSKRPLIPKLFTTPLRSRRKINRRSKSIIDENTKGRYQREMKLSKKIKNLTKEQLSELILKVSSSNPEIEKVSFSG